MDEAKNDIEENADTPTGVTRGLGEGTAQAAMPPTGPVWAWRKWPVILMLVFSDILLALLVWWGAYVLHSVWGRSELSEITLLSVAPNVAVWIGTRALLGLYPGYGLSATETLRRHTHAVLITLATTSIFALAFQVGDSLSRLLLGLGFLILLLVAPLARYLAKRGMMGVGLWGKPVAILGAGETGAQLVHTLQREWGLGFMPVAVFDFRLAQTGGGLEGVPYGGTVIDALNLARKQSVDTAIFAMPQVRREYLAKFVDKASLSFRHIIVIPDLLGVTNSAVVARDLGGVCGVEIKYNLLNPWARRAKRALDLFGVVGGGLLISPLVLAMVALIKLDSPGPAFYKHKRLGAAGEHFDCWKFRTMRADAERLLTELLQSDPNLQAEWERNHKLRKDPRITRVGRFLRRTSLDELPQIWNVLRGEMSLVGPRPIVDAEVHRYKETYRLYQRVTPGITGLWQVSGRSDTSFEERVAMDAYYAHNWSVWLDLVILARTARSVIFSRGAF